MCNTYKTPIPKGAGDNVDKIGMELVEKYGKDVLDKIAKKNFSNTKRILKTMIYLFHFILNFYYFSDEKYYIYI